MAMLLPASAQAAQSPLFSSGLPVFKGAGALKPQVATPATSFGSEATCSLAIGQEEEVDWEFDCYGPCQVIPEESQLDEVSELETEEAWCDAAAEVPQLLLAVEAVAPQRSVHLKKSGKMERMLEDLRNESLAVETILHDLAGSIRKFAYNRVGCRVLEELLARVPQGSAGVIIDEMLGDVAEASTHRYASRVLSALVEYHCVGDDLDVTTKVFLEEFMQATPELVRDVFGHRVVLKLLVQSTTLCHCVVSSLRQDCEGLMMHGLDETGSVVVAAALRCAAVDDQEAMAEDLLEEHPSMLAVGAPGCRVLRSLLQHTSLRDEIVEQLQEAQELLEMSKHGRRLANEFNLMDEM
jgi:hypothetical protein